VCVCVCVCVYVCVCLCMCVCVCVYVCVFLTPAIAVDEIGIPDVFAKELTYTHPYP